MYSETTGPIRVFVEPHYLPDHSDPEDHRYVWAYRVTIENLGDEQPVIRPGESFEYTSGTPLGTPSGFMSGHYDMTGPDGQVFTVSVPSFALDLPEAAGRPN